MNYKILITVIMSFSFVLSMPCQTKNEKEERTTISEFPETAQNIVNALPKKCKRLRFYKETDGEKQSFEAKFKYKKQYYSLEFSVNGSIEDIEIIIKPSKIEDTIKENITTYFKNSYTTFNFIKIQKQYRYFEGLAADQFISDVLSQNPKTPANFEIVAEVKAQKKRIIKEFTFNNRGIFLNSRVLKPTSYEYVLY